MDEAAAESAPAPPSVRRRLRLHGGGWKRKHEQSDGHGRKKA
jgi:hypothetical protein